MYVRWGATNRHVLPLRKPLPAIAGEIKYCSGVFFMQCPICKSIKIKSHAVQPVRYGGRNAISHYSCNRCGVMFVKTEHDPDDTMESPATDRPATAKG